LRAFVGEERFPVEEGWKVRGGGWFEGLGIVELVRMGVRAWREIGLSF
jgi:hypothetical protein